jgi:hypothetical protein
MDFPASVYTSFLDLKARRSKLIRNNVLADRNTLKDGLRMADLKSNNFLYFTIEERNQLEEL